MLFLIFHMLTPLRLQRYTKKMTYASICHSFRDFFRFWSRILAVVLGVILLAADVPEVRFHGLFATGGVLLLEEGCAVGCDLREVFDALVDSCLYLGEARARCEAALRLADVLTVGVGLADVETRAVGVGGGCRAVRTDQVITVAVTIYFLRFCQGALYELNTRRINDFSHVSKCV